MSNEYKDWVNDRLQDADIYEELCKDLLDYIGEKHNIADKKEIKCPIHKKMADMVGWKRSYKDDTWDDVISKLHGGIYKHLAIDTHKRGQLIKLCDNLYKETNATTFSLHGNCEVPRFDGRKAKKKYFDTSIKEITRIWEEFVANDIQVTIVDSPVSWNEGRSHIVEVKGYKLEDFDVEEFKDVERVYIYQLGHDMKYIRIGKEPSCTTQE